MSKSKKKCPTCKKVHKKCAGHKKDGNPCGRNPNKDSDLCYACIKNQQSSHSDDLTFLEKVYNADSVNEDDFEDEFDQQAARFYEAWEITFGNISASCEYAGITRVTYYDWMKSSLTHHINFRRKLEQIRPKERALDIAEANLFKHIKEGNERMITYYLDRQGGDRGYTPKTIREELTEDEKIEATILMIERRAIEANHSYPEELEIYLEIYEKTLPETAVKKLKERAENVG